MFWKGVQPIWIKHCWITLDPNPSIGKAMFFFQMILEKFRDNAKLDWRLDQTVPKCVCWTAKVGGNLCEHHITFLLVKSNFIWSKVLFEKSIQNPFRTVATMGQRLPDCRADRPALHYRGPNSEQPKEPGGLSGIMGIVELKLSQNRIIYGIIYGIVYGIIYW